MLWIFLQLLLNFDSNDSRPKIRIFWSRWTSYLNCFGSFVCWLLKVCLKFSHHFSCTFLFKTNIIFNAFKSLKWMIWKTCFLMKKKILNNRYCQYGQICTQRWVSPICPNHIIVLTLQNVSIFLTKENIYQQTS